MGAVGGTAETGPIVATLHRSLEGLGPHAVGPATDVAVVAIRKQATGPEPVDFLNLWVLIMT